MNKHPISVWSMGGTPSGDVTGRPSPADVESWGASWTAASDDYLVGLAARQIDPTTNAIAALIESQRRLKGAIAVFEDSARASSRTLLDAQTKLLTSIDAFSDCSSQQTAEMIKLTDRLRVLTWVLVGFGALQIAIGILQIVLMLRTGGA